VDELRADLEYLNQAGYTTVTCRELLAYCSGEGGLPDKPIVLTFDDGFYNNYVYVHPMLQQYRMKAVLGVVGEFSWEQKEPERLVPLYSNITPNQLHEMQASGVWELANHSYKLHDNTHGRTGCAQKRGEPDEAYGQALTDDVSRLQNALAAATGLSPVTFVYPFGAYSKTTDDHLRAAGMTVTLSCEEGMNYLNPGDDLFRLHRYNRPHGRSTQAVFDKLTIKN